MSLEGLLRFLMLGTQMIEELLGKAEDCEWDCKGELTTHSDTASEAVAEELLQQANCGGRKMSSRWEDGQAPVLVSGAGHDSLPMSGITQVLSRQPLVRRAGVQSWVAAHVVMEWAR